MSIPPSKIKLPGNLATLLEVFSKEIARNLNCVQIGTIESFNSANQTAEVSINFKRLINEELREYAVLIDVPCVVMNGGGGGISFPISKGDNCVILFNDRDIDNWYASGAVMEPNSARTHSMSDAIAIVGINSLATSISDYLASGTKIWYGGAMIKLENSTITIENGAGGTVVLSGGNITVTGTQVDVNAAAINLNGAVTATTMAIAGAFTVQGKDIGPTHTHRGVYPGSGSTGGVN